jgi:streptogramin lyase
LAATSQATGSSVPGRAGRTAFAAALGLVVAACSGDGTVAPSVPASAAPSTAPTASVVPIGPPTVGLAELEHLEISLSGGPDFPVGLDGSVWILAPDGPLGPDGEQALVHRLDATTGDVEAEIPIDGRLCQGLNAGFGSVWACTDTGLARIDPARNEVVAEVAFDTAQVFARPAIGGGRVWALGGNGVPDSVVEIDPQTNAVVATHPLDHTAATLAFGGGAVWATAPADGQLLRLDPTTGEVTVHADDFPAPWIIAYGAGSLWISLYGEHGGEQAAAGEPTIARVSVGDGSVQALVFINSPTTSEADIWASDDAVWIRSVGDPFLLLIDPATNAVGYAIAGFHSGGSLTVIDGAVWTTSIEFATVWRIEP